MWLPRLAAIAIIIISVVSYFLIAQFVSANPLVPNATFFDVAAVVMYLMSVFLTLAGIGGVIASFAYDLDVHGCMQPKQNVLGRCFARVMPAEAQSFCNISSVTGLMLGAICIGTAVVGFLTYVVVSRWYEGGAMAAAVIISACIVGAILIKLIIRFQVIATRIMNIVTCSMFAGFLGYVGYQILYGKPRGDMDWTGLLMALGVIAITYAATGAFLIGLNLLKRLKHYAMICPMRLPNKMQPTT